MKEPVQMQYEYRRGMMCASGHPIMPSNPEPNETCWILPDTIGKGSFHRIEIRPGFEIWISDCRFKQEVFFPPHKLPSQVQSSFILSGDYHLRIDGYPALFEQTGERQGIICSNGSASTCTVQAGTSLRHVGTSISPELFFSYFKDGMSPELRAVFERKAKTLYQYAGPITPEMRSVIQRILTYSGRGIARKLFFESRALGLLAYQLEQMSERESRADSNERLHPVDKRQTEQAKDFLVRNMETPVSLGELSQKAGMSPPKLNRCFKQMYGMTVFKYLRTERLNKARDRLENTGFSITEIAYQVGYDSPSHFAKAYKQRFGTSPRNFRHRMHQSGP